MYWKSFRPNFKVPFSTWVLSKHGKKSLVCIACVFCIELCVLLVTHTHSMTRVNCMLTRQTIWNEDSNESNTVWNFITRFQKHRCHLQCHYCYSIGNYNHQHSNGHDNQVLLHETRKYRRWIVWISENVCFNTVPKFAERAFTYIKAT